MTEQDKLKDPWLVAVWPGMGHVAMAAGYYLMAKLGMHSLAEFSPRGLFEVEHADVQGGLIRTGRLPRSRFFVWRDPRGEHDLVVFIGEAQPPVGKYAFCQRLIDFAKDLGVKRVFTIGALATPMRPEHESRVAAAATNEAGLAELKHQGLEIIEDGHIGGLHGILLGVAAEQGLSGYSLLGEMPQLFVQLPFPKASLAVLERFATFAEIELDFQELREQVQAMEVQFGQVMAQIDQTIGQETEEEESWPTPDQVEQRLSPDDERRIEQLFLKARQSKATAYELKALLDRLEVFKDYEDRFLDLFAKPDGELAA